MDLTKLGKVDNIKVTKISTNQNRNYIADVPISFDIQTQQGGKGSYMYWFGFKIRDEYVCGRTWNEFEQVMLNLSKVSKKGILVVWCYDLFNSFEYFKNYVDLTDVKTFSIVKGKPLTIRLNNKVEFRDINMFGDLDYLAKNYMGVSKEFDLDDTKVRNDLTDLADDEKILFNKLDVISYFGNYLMTEYGCKYSCGKNGKNRLPLTKTSVLNLEIEDRINQEFNSCENINRRVKELFPSSEGVYRAESEYLFRGGFVFNNVIYQGVTEHNVWSYDIKSSYPAAALHYQYPISSFVEVDVDKINDKIFDYLIKNKHCIFLANFTDIKANQFAIEMQNKVIDSSCLKCSEGKVLEAKKLCVMLTEVDYQNYLEFYKWREMEIISLKYADKGELPKYLTDMFYKYYNLKMTLEKGTREYEICKTNLNGLYGLCVKKLYGSNIIYNNGEWVEVEATDYQKQIKNKVLSPYWGIYIAAYARRDELKLFSKVYNYVRYSDTDSHKIKYFDGLIDIVDNYNKEQGEMTKLTCDRLGYDFDILKDIGKFVLEDKYDRFKTLGNKKYLYQIGNNYHSVVSGLQKDAVIKYCKQEGIFDIFDLFKIGLTIPSQISGTYRYVKCGRQQEVIVDYQGNTSKMNCEGGYRLIPTDYCINEIDNKLESLYIKINRMRLY